MSKPGRSCKKNQLTSEFVFRTDLKPGKYSDGGNLALQVAKTDSRSKSWIFRYDYKGRERYMGLGSVDLVSLKEARECAVAARKILITGRDPLEVRYSVYQQSNARLADDLGLGRQQEEQDCGSKVNNETATVGGADIGGSEKRFVRGLGSAEQPGDYGGARERNCPDRGDDHVERDGGSSSQQIFAGKPGSQGQTSERAAAQRGCALTFWSGQGVLLDQFREAVLSASQFAHISEELLSKTADKAFGRAQSRLVERCVSACEFLPRGPLTATLKGVTKRSLKELRVSVSALLPIFFETLSACRLSGVLCPFCTTITLSGARGGGSIFARTLQQRYSLALIEFAVPSALKIIDGETGACKGQGICAACAELLAGFAVAEHFGKGGVRFSPPRLLQNIIKLPSSERHEEELRWVRVLAKMGRTASFRKRRLVDNAARFRKLRFDPKRRVVL